MSKTELKSQFSVRILQQQRQRNMQDTHHGTNLTHYINNELCKNGGNTQERSSRFFGENFNPHDPGVRAMSEDLNKD